MGRPVAPSVGDFASDLTRVEPPSMPASAIIAPNGSVVPAAAPKKDSAICETAVWLAGQAGLPPFLQPAAYELCVKSLPALKRRGITTAKQLAQVLSEKVSAKYLVTKFSSMAMGRKQKSSVQGKPTSTRQALTPAVTRAVNQAVRNAPAAVSRRVAGKGRPRMRVGGKGVVIVHSEMLGSIVSNATINTFTANGFVLNPGKFGTFPWLASLASNFDKYIVRSCIVHFVSSQPTNIAGKVGIGFDYDSTDPLPVDRNEFFSLTHHVECSTWDSVSMSIPLDVVPRFVNSHTNTDSKLIDAGNIILMSDQVPTASLVLGDIILEYAVELIEPQQAIYCSQIFSSTSAIAAWSSLSVSGPVLALQLPTTSITDVEYALPQGYYSYFCVASDSGLGSPVLTATTHNMAASNGSSETTTGRAFAHGVLKVTTNDATVKFVLSVVTLANTERLKFLFSRISPVVFNDTVRTGVGATLGTY